MQSKSNIVAFWSDPCIGVGSMPRNRKYSRRARASNGRTTIRPRRKASVPSAAGSSRGTLLTKALNLFLDLAWITRTVLECLKASLRVGVMARMADAKAERIDARSKAAERRARDPGV